MSVQEPAWLKRTRPCPFFSQGRCLFADSCNFLHDVKVRSAVNQPLRNTIQVRRLSLPPKHIFDPPSVVVNSASPRSVVQSSEPFVQDSSRYSGLLSVLSDVIGPPSDPPSTTEDAVPASRTMSTVPSGVQNLVYTCTNEPLESNQFVAGFERTLAAAEMEMERGYVEPSAILEPGFKANPVDRYGYQMGCFPPEKFLPVHEESGDGDTTAYFVEAADTYVIGSEIEGDGADEEEMDDHGGEDPTVMLSNRQSTLSSFTGVSLLATPRHSVFGEPSIASPIEDGIADLLSPVQLSAKLRPFPIASSASRTKRGDSIDSGYADGDNWVGPLPFPRSPPRVFRSSVTLLPHSRRASLSSPALRAKRVSYDVGAIRSSAHNPIEVIEEVARNGSPEDVEDTSYTILDAYGTSPLGEQVEGRVTGPLQVNIEAEEDGKSSEVLRCPLRCSPEHLHPTREYDVDSNQPSFISDDNLSFKTALSTQPSYEDLSDISRVSPVKQDSWLSSLSNSSTPSTSVLSHYGDANDFLEQSNVGSHACESSCLGSQQVDNAGEPEARPLDDNLLQEKAAFRSNTPFAAAGADHHQRLAAEKAVSPERTLSGVLHSNRHCPISCPSVNTSRSLSPAKDVLEYLPPSPNDLRKPASEKVAILRESDVFHFDKQPPDPSPLAEHSHRPPVNDAPSITPLVTEDHWQSGSKNVASLQERLPGGDFHVDTHTAKLATSAETAHDSFLVENGLGYVSPGAQDPAPENAADAQECVPRALRFVRPCSSAENFHSLSMVKDVLEYASPTADDDCGSQEAFPLVLHDRPATFASPSLDPDGGLGSNEVTRFFDSECDNFTQHLSFPLPPPFLPAEIVGHSTLSGEEDVSDLSEVATADPEGDVLNVHGVSQEEEMERIHLGSDLTEKALPSQLPLVGSPDSGTELTLRRSRAASDLTVKAKSPPMIVPADAFDMLRSPSASLEQPGRCDSVQSLYDQYFDDDSPDDGSDFSGPAHKDMAPSDVPSPNEEPSREDYLRPLDITPYVAQRVSAMSSDDEPSGFGAPVVDSPRSEGALRPLLTGRRSFLRSSLSELNPKADLASEKESSPRHPSGRLQVREIGSTMVPLGFRRHKPQPAVTYSPRLLRDVLPASGLREVLRIRTDVAREDFPLECSSASRVSFTTRSPLPVKAMSAPPTGGLRQLHLVGGLLASTSPADVLVQSSTINKRSSILSTHSSSIASSILSLDQSFNASIPQSPSVSSITSFSRNSPLLSSCEQIPGKVHHTLKRSSSNSLILPANGDVYLESQSSSTRRDSRSVSAPVQQPKPWRLSHYRAGSRNYTSADGTHRVSRRISTLSLPYAVDEAQEIDENEATPSRPIQSKLTDDWTRPASVLAAPVHAIATPKPNLLFAIASDDVDQVRRVLESGEAGPNDCVGPQSALAFTLTNDKLTHKQEIVKALLAYGANPSALRNPTSNPPPRKEGGDELSDPPPETTLEGMDPATRYFVTRADAAHTRQTSQLIYRSFFRPLTRVRYDVIGQDWALEQLFRVLSIQSQKLAVAPIVVLLCGPSGHGKSLLARKFGSLLDVPTHTVNMTTLQSAHDIWQSYSMSPYEEPSSCTLAEFLVENEGKRCVVVLDEIEKVEDQKALWSLLMPWELGRCSLEAGKRHVNARNVIWLGTSNVGHELVFEHHENRAEPDKRMSREEYLELTTTLRPRVSHGLGASLVSRVTTVLPFVPFTLDEKKAIAAEAVYALAGNASKTLSPQGVESLVTKSLLSYHPSEGARSLHRAISNLLVDVA